jgi:hypothetical protein
MRLVSRHFFSDSIDIVSPFVYRKTINAAAAAAAATTTTAAVVWVSNK